MSMFDGYDFDGVDIDAEMARVVSDVNERARLEALHVITPEEQQVIDTAERVRSRIVDVGLVQGQFDRVRGKRLEQLRTWMLNRRFGALPRLEFRIDSIDNIIVEAPKVVIPGFPSIAYWVSVRDSESDSFGDVGPNTACRWFELGMFASRTVEIQSVGSATQKYRREFSMAGNERPRVHDLQHTSDFAINDEGVSVPYYVSPERLAQAGVILDLTMTALQGKKA